MEKWEQYLEGNYDKKGSLLKKYKQRKDDEREAKGIAEEVKQYQEDILKVLESYTKDDEKGQYLVNGALLTCNQATWDPFPVPGQDDIILDTEQNEEKDSVPVGVLVVDNDDMSVNNELYATVKDAVINENVFPFQCNCKKAADRVKEIEAIKDDPSCKKDGVCKHLMKLNDEWENLPLAGQFYKAKEFDKNELETNGEIEMSECITMTSMLFCRHGGLITPVTSGQNIAVPLTWENISELGAWSEERIKLAQFITKKMLEAGYSYEIIAGMVGNVVNEGLFGQFENSNYTSTSPPKYLQHMNEYHNYQEIASAKSLTSTGMGIFEQLEKNEECSKDSKPHKYGLGAVQWTGDRCDRLIEKYKERFGMDESPTYVQCQQIEIEYMLEELSGDYKSVIELCEEKLNEMEGEKAVAEIAKIFYEKYEKAGTDTGGERQADACLWYEVLIGEYDEVEDNE